MGAVIVGSLNFNVLNSTSKSEFLTIFPLFKLRASWIVVRPKTLSHLKKTENFCTKTPGGPSSPGICFQETFVEIIFNYKVSSLTIYADKSETFEVTTDFFENFQSFFPY